jgi:hypothetical protein
MNESGVQRDDMDPLLTEDGLSNVLSGRVDPAHADDQFVAFLADGADSLRSLEPGRPSPALREFLGVTSSHTYPPIGGTVVTGDIDSRRSGPSQRKSKMLTSAVAFAATLTGKLLLSAAVAAAAMGGAHATGVVDLAQDNGDAVAVAVTDRTSAGLGVGAAVSSAGGSVVAQGSADAAVEQQVTVRIPIDQVGAFVMSLEGDALVLETVEVLAGSTAMVQADGSVLFTTGAGQVVVGATFDGTAIRLSVIRGGLTTTNLFDTVGQLLSNDGEVGVGANATIGAAIEMKPSTIVDMGVDSAGTIGAGVDAAAGVVGLVPGAVGAGVDAAGVVGLVPGAVGAGVDAADSVTDVVKQGLDLSGGADVEASANAQGGLDLGGAVGGSGSLFGS